LLSNHALQVSIPVSTRTDEWIAAEVFKDEFMHSQKDSDVVDATTELESNSGTLVLFAHFFGLYCGQPTRGPAVLSCLQASLRSSSNSNHDKHQLRNHEVNSSRGKGKGRLYLRSTDSKVIFYGSLPYRT
jgi:hypothetical protein